MQALFTKKKNEDLAKNFKLENSTAKIKVIENWQKGIVSGKIRTQNERKLQSEFLNKIFGEVLGYTYEKHLDTWHLDNEVKVDLDGKTPDGALGYFSFDDKKVKSDIRVVIELKGPLVNLDKKQNRVDFKGSPVEQAFSYVPKLNKPCHWVIVSNCIEIRLYRYQLGMTAYESFDLTTLLLNGQFKLFCYLLEKDRLFLETQTAATEQLLNEQQAALSTITDKFYSGYKERREKLFAQLCKQNPAVAPAVLLSCTQKIIDRLIFMCFARDLDLVKNMIDGIKRVAEESFGQEDDKIWTELRRAFVALDKGYVRKNIPPFNGGLFKPDPVIDSLVVSDFRLQDIMDYFNQYDYLSELNVSVLGHIFEQSITDLEEMKGPPTPRGGVSLTPDPTPDGLKKKETPPLGAGGLGLAKRKKDGVFYTPDYITRYMVQQSVGAWLDEREQEILQLMAIDRLPDLADDDYRSITLSATGQYARNPNIALHVTFWERYENHLRRLRILDPACGSGAFLTEVFDYLWNKWRIMKEETWRLVTPYDKQLLELATGSGLANASISKYNEWEIKKNISANNLYGVDINAESVEITKLSIWLKTANKKESLASLVENIQQGNSLIADPTVAGADAFDWAARFAPIMAEGGFDIVVGNPPYVRQELIDKEIKATLSQQYKVGNGTADLYVYFYELGIGLLKPSGFLSYITPNKWFKTKYGAGLRNYLKPFDIKRIIDFFELQIFEDAATEPQIIVVKNQTNASPVKYAPIKVTDKFLKNEFDYIHTDRSNLSESEWIFANDATNDILKKLYANSITLDEYTKGGILYGIKTGLNKAFVIDKATKEKIIKKDPKSAEIIKPYIQATDIKAWHLENKDSSFLIFTRRGTDIDKYVGVKNYLMQFYDDLKPKTNENDTQGRKPGTYKWFEIQDSVDYYKAFDAPKIMYIYTATKHYFHYDTENYVVNNSCFLISNADLFLSVWLNSSIFEFYKKLKFVAYGNADDGGRCKLDYNKMVNVPIPNLNVAQKEPFIKKAEAMLVLSKSLYELSEAFLSVVRAELKPEKINSKLEGWYKLPYDGFVAEVKKQKGSFGTLAKQMEWQAFFRDSQTKATAAATLIAQTDSEIDALVYALYDLTPDEIAVVEG